MAAPQSRFDEAILMRYSAKSLAGLALLVSLPVAAAPELEGTDWQLISYTLDGTPVAAAEAPKPASLRFEKQRIAGSVGCNRILGGYKLDGEQLKTSAGGMTMMACPEPLMQQEQAATKALGEVASFRIEGSELILQDAAGGELLRFAEMLPSPLTGITWHLTSYNNGRKAITSVLAGSEVTLKLDDEGQLSGNGGCNVYRGGYESTGTSFALIGSVAATRMACPGPEGATEQENAYFAALESAAGYEIRGGELTLKTAEGKIAARFGQ